MKKLLLPGCLLIVFFSCNKNVSSVGTGNNSMANSSISAVVDGQTINFSAKVAASPISASLGHSLGITGYTTCGSDAEEMIITIASKTPLTAGTTYTSLDEGDNVLGMEYLQPGGIEYATDNNSIKAGNSVTVRITSISDSKVEGTFSGTVAPTCHSSTTGKRIENGRFSATISQ